MKKPNITPFQQRTFNISGAKIKEFNEALERVDRGICMVSTALFLLTNDNDMYTNFGRSMEVGLYELASELENRFDELEKISNLLTKQEEQEEG